MALVKNLADLIMPHVRRKHGSWDILFFSTHICDVNDTCIYIYMCIYIEYDRIYVNHFF